MGQVQVVPASLPRTSGPERLAEFIHRVSARPGQPRLGYPPSYFNWLAAIPGRDSYMDAVLIDGDRQIVGAAISRPLTLGVWSNLKLRAAIRDAIASTAPDRSAKGWVRYLTRAKDAELAAALGHLLPEEHFALKAAVIEFLCVDPRLPGRGTERTLLDVIVEEARAAQYDYLLCWAERLPPQWECAARAAGAEAVLEVLPEDDSGLLRTYNLARRAALGARRLARQLRAAVVRTAAATRRKASRVWRRVARPRRRPVDTETAGPGPRAPGQEQGERPEHRSGGAEAPSTQPSPTRRGGPSPHPDSHPTAPGPTLTMTLDGTLVRRVGGPDLPLTDDLLEQIRALMTDTQDRYGVFPTYDAGQLRALLAPAHDGARFPAAYAQASRGEPSILTSGLGHDVLTYVATKDSQVVACVFGHRLPWFAGDRASESWVIRATYFGRRLGGLRRADILQRCAEAAAAEYGIQRVLLLRPAGLGERIFSRYVLGTKGRPDRLTLRYVPLSESALAEEAVLARPLPVGYI